MVVTQYPTNLPTTAQCPTGLQNNVDDVLVEQVNPPHAEILAICTELGTLPKSAYADVKTFLAQLLSWTGQDLSSGSIPNLAGLTGNVLTFSGQSMSRVYRGTSVQNVDANTVTKVQFNTSSFDVNSNWDLSTNYDFTASEDGKFQVNSTVRLSSSVTGTVFNIYIYVNGGLVSYEFLVVSGTAGESISVVDIMDLDTDDYIEIFINHSKVGGADIAAAVFHTWCSIGKIA